MKREHLIKNREARCNFRSSEISILATFAAFSEFCCLRMLLLNRRRKIKKEVFHANVKQESLYPAPLLSHTPAALYNICSSYN